MPAPEETERALEPLTNEFPGPGKEGVAGGTSAD